MLSLTRFPALLLVSQYTLNIQDSRLCSNTMSCAFEGCQWAYFLFNMIHRDDKKSTKTDTEMTTIEQQTDDAVSKVGIEYMFDDKVSGTNEKLAGCNPVTELVVDQNNECTTTDFETPI